MQNIRSIRSIGWLLLALVMLLMPAASHAQVAVSITVAPPALPVYVQPVCPGDNYLWTPGYWSWSDDDGDYYWVPGTWVEAPTPGFLWTPGYWGWNNGAYAWNAGYWGPHVGFYGGVNYGFGYVGVGFEGGYWQGGNFFYNRSVSNVNVTVIHNVYTKTVVNNYNTTTRASFNGPGGVTRKPTAQEETYSHEQHTPATSAQTQHREDAAKDRSQYASVNHGKPAVAATAKPGEFKGAGVVPAKAAAPYRGATGKGVANARGEKSTGAKAPARDTEHTSTANEHKSTSSEAKPVARENTEHAENRTKTTTHSKTPRTESEKPKTEAAKPKTETAKPTKESAPRKTESTPKTATHESAPKPKHEAAPKATHESAPKPEHETAPKATHESAPKPEHEAAPKATHESAPKPEHEAAPKASSKPEEKPKH
ncbi:MAG: hypothetical protein WCD49_12990 [Candidatus Acidiferrales bacterium]